MTPTHSSNKAFFEYDNPLSLYNESLSLFPCYDFSTTTSYTLTTPSLLYPQIIVHAPLIYWGKGSLMNIIDASARTTASTYAQSHQRTLSQFTSVIRDHLDFIRADWIETESEDGSTSESDSSSDAKSVAVPVFECNSHLQAAPGALHKHRYSSYSQEQHLSQTIEGQDGVGEKKDGSDEKRVKLLDYACGSGLVSQALAPYVTSAVGIDVSPAMVREYNTAASNQGLSRHEMYAYVGDLVENSLSPSRQLLGLSPTASASTHLQCDLEETRESEQMVCFDRQGTGLVVAEDDPQLLLQLPHKVIAGPKRRSSTPDLNLAGLTFWDFDIASIVMALHHIHDTTLAIRRLASRLRPGGVLWVMDYTAFASPQPPRAAPQKQTPHPAGMDDDDGEQVEVARHFHEVGTEQQQHKSLGEHHQSASSDTDRQVGLRNPSEAHTIKHKGFSRDDMAVVFTEAGVGQGFEYLILGKGTVRGSQECADRRREVFIARGQKGGWGKPGTGEN